MNWEERMQRDDGGKGGRAPFQFELRALMLVVTAVAVAFAAGRTVYVLGGPWVFVACLAPLGAVVVAGIASVGLKCARAVFRKRGANRKSDPPQVENWER
jgi:fatty acid desaturase